MTVDVDLESLDGKVQCKVNAFTTEKVTGDMEVINWNEYVEKWEQLAGKQFPKIGPNPLIDLLIEWIVLIFITQ